MSLDFDYLIKTSVERAAKWHPGFPVEDGPDSWNLADWSNAMGGECGEAQNVAKKIRRIETGHEFSSPGLTEDDLDEMLGYELADTILYAVLVAAKRGIDLPAAIVEKFNLKSEEAGLPDRLYLDGGVPRVS